MNKTTLTARYTLHPSSTSPLFKIWLDKANSRDEFLDSVNTDYAEFRVILPLSYYAEAIILEKIETDSLNQLFIELLLFSRFLSLLRIEKSWVYKYASKLIAKHKITGEKTEVYVYGKYSFVDYFGDYFSLITEDDTIDGFLDNYEFTGELSV